jgi:methionyl aminopeptidase
MPVRSPLSPGQLSPRRPVPARIARPEYVDKPRAARDTSDGVRTPEVIEGMRIASRLAAQALVEGGKVVKPGATTDDIDAVVHEFLCDNGAYPSTLGYPSSAGAPNYTKSCCTSLNEVICHGIPDSTVIQDGDICNIDVTAFIHGVHGDTNATFLAGDVAEEARLLVERTHEATMRSIRAVKPGRQLNVIGRVIEAYAKRFDYGVVRAFTGHGVGPYFHGTPTVLHYDEPAVTMEIKAGMTFTIEPMITLGTIDYDMWDDGWTVLTKDRRLTAQFEHTLLVTEDGAEILTLP